MAQRLKLEGGGWLEMREEGTLVHLSAYRAMDSAGLYKVWLLGTGPDFLLGTLIPEDGQLKLQRTLSLDTLKQASCWPISGAKAAMFFPFTAPEKTAFYSSWRWEHRPSTRFTDPLLVEAVGSWGSMLLRELEGGFQLAAPFDPKHPFPITLLFCLAQITQVDGQSHAVFTFAPDGTPQQSAET